MGIQKVLSGSQDRELGLRLSHAQFQTVFETYLMPTFIVPTEDNVICEPSYPSEVNIQKLATLSKSHDESNAIYLRRIRRDESPCQSVLLKSDHGELYFYMECDDMENRNKCTSFTAHFLRINYIDDVCDFRELKIRLVGDEAKITNPCKSSVYYGNGRMHLAGNYELLDANGLVHHSIISAVNVCLFNIRKCLSESTSRAVPVHGPLYMEIAKNVRATFPESYEHLEMFFNVHSVEIPENCLHSPTMDDKEHPIMDMSQNESNKYPLVNLTERERTWVHNYSFPRMGKDDPYPSYAEAIGKCRFGDTFRVVRVLKNKNLESVKRELTINFSHEDGLTRFMIREILRPGIGVLGVLTYTDDAHIPFDCDFIKVSLVINKGAPMPNDHSILDESVLVTGGSKLIALLCIETLELLMVIHDRPEKYTTLKKYKPRGNYKKHERSNEVIVHILQTKSRTRKQLAEAKERGEDVERNYVIPEWIRCEHVRHYKSGKTVVIGTSVCRRHKPLAEHVEVKIKL